MRMEKEVMVSILCMTYNQEKYITDALESFLNQITDFAYEVIIHDDASTDSTASIIRAYQEKYPDIIKPIFQKENQFSKEVKIFYEFMLPVAKGKYIAICDGDDYWTDPYKLQKQYDFLEANPEYSICYHRAEYLNVISGERRGIWPNQPVGRSYCLDEILLKFKNPFPPMSFFVRTNVVKKMPSEFFCYFMLDQPLVIFSALHGKSFCLQDVMGRYRLNENSVSANWRETGLRTQANADMIRILSLAEEYTKGKHHDLIQYCTKYYQYHLRKHVYGIEAVQGQEYDEVRNKKTDSIDSVYTDS